MNHAVVHHYTDRVCEPANDPNAHRAKDGGYSETSLEDIVEGVVAVAQKDDVSVSDITSVANKGQFASLLLLPALALVTPLSGIPLFSTVMGLIITVISAQMLFVNSEVWLPRRIRALEVKGAVVRRAFEKIKPATRWLNGAVRPRLTFLLSGPAAVIPPILCMISGLILPVLEFVPFTASIVGVGVSLIAVAQLSRDGLLLLIGYVPLGIVGFAVWKILLVW